MPLAIALVSSNLSSCARTHPGLNGRREIVEAAAGLFRKNGYASTGFNDIAEALGEDRPTIYYYVASKRELLLKAVRDAVANVSNGAHEKQNGLRVEFMRGTAIRIACKSLCR